jgi:hypothetical protein
MEGMVTAEVVCPSHESPILHVGVMMEIANGEFQVIAGFSKSCKGCDVAYILARVKEFFGSLRENDHVQQKPVTVVVEGNLEMRTDLKAVLNGYNVVEVNVE